jgi:S-adenosylmethionine decarboxylase proenzyme
MKDYGTLATKSLGTHAVVDLVYPQNSTFLLNSGVLYDSMLEACTENGATVLQSSDHSFGDAGGFTFLVLLAESHVSAHTWPAEGIAVLDIFMCGKTSAFETMQTFLDKLTLRQAKPDKTFETKLFRGFHLTK